MKKWILGLVVCVVIGGCIGCDTESLNTVIAATQQTTAEVGQEMADPNSGINEAVDAVGNGAETVNSVISSPVGVLIPEPWRTGGLLITSLVAGAAAWWQRSRKNLAVKTLGATVNAIENSGVGSTIKPTVKANLMQSQIYPDGKQLIMSVKQ